MNRYVLTTGGTGGHIFPAIAVAAEIRRRDASAELLFIGSSYGPEARLARQAGIPFKGLPVRGFLGRGLRAIAAGARLCAALSQAVWLVGRFRPNAVAAFGGYAAFAPAMAAKLLGIPVLLHEQNACTGASNRIIARFAAARCASLPHTMGLEDAVLTGNPVRAEICRARHQGPRNGKRLLILGGSQGAHALNLFISNILPQLKEAGVQICHQCGEKDHAECRASYESNGLDPSCVVPFINDMAGRYAWADLVFCRAGASTIAELCASASPAVLVPFPAAIHDHQTLNARVMASEGAAVIVPEAQLDVQTTARQLLAMLADSAQLEKMSTAALNLARPDAAALLVDELEKISK